MITAIMAVTRMDILEWVSMLTLPCLPVLWDLAITWDWGPVYVCNQILPRKIEKHETMLISGYHLCQFEEPPLSY